MRAAPLGILLTLTIAGCVGPQADLPAEDPSQGPVESWHQSLDGQGCQTVRAYFMVEASRADQWLPPGFWPADSQDTPPAFVTVRDGRVPALVSSTQCQSGLLSKGPFSFGYAGFQVRQPVPSEVSQDASQDFYIAAAFADNDVVRAELAAAGWPVDRQGADATVDPAAPQLQLQEIRQVALQIADGDDIVAQITGETFYASEDQPPFLFRAWHVSDEGLAYLETEPPTEANLGTMRECSISEGRAVAEVIGPVGCDQDGTVTEQLGSSSSRWMASLDAGELPTRLVAIPGWQP